MPKYKSPDGKVFDNAYNALAYYCDIIKHCCNNCFIGKHIDNVSDEYMCNAWVAKHAEEAAHLMGYEIIEDAQEAKADKDKPRPSLVQPALIRADMGVREYGCQKYHKPDNWRNVEAARYWDALLRHALAAWDDWTAVDPESGMPHLWHIATNAAFLMQYMEENNENGTGNHGGH